MVVAGTERGGRRRPEREARGEAPGLVAGAVQVEVHVVQPRHRGQRGALEQQQAAPEQCADRFAVEAELLAGVLVRQRRRQVDARVGQLAAHRHRPGNGVEVIGDDVEPARIGDREPRPAEAVVGAAVVGDPAVELETLPRRGGVGQARRDRGLAVVVHLEAVPLLAGGDARPLRGDDPVAQAVYDVDLVVELVAAGVERAEEATAEIGQGRRDDARRHQRPIDDVVERRVVGDVELTDGRQQHAGTQVDGVVEQEVHRRGLQDDLPGAVLELDLRGEADAVGDLRGDEDVEAPRLEGEAVRDPLLLQVAAGEVQVAADGHVGGGGAETEDVGPVVDAAAHHGLRAVAGGSGGRVRRRESRQREQGGQEQASHGLPSARTMAMPSALAWTGSGSSGRSAGPSTTSPARSKREPWQGHR